MIDGLDEIDGDPKMLLQLIVDIAKCRHVKVCIASRPSPEFLHAFQGRPCLRLEDFNRQDICNHVTASFASNEIYLKLSK